MDEGLGTEDGAQQPGQALFGESKKLCVQAQEVPWDELLWDMVLCSLYMFICRQS